MTRPSETPHFRAFVAIALSAELLAAVQQVQQRLAPKLEGVRWVGREQLHLTLRFFGDVASAELDALKEALSRATMGIEPFELRVRELGCFPSLQRPSVLWLGLAGQLETLHQLQLQIEQETKRFGSHSEERAFHPHLTIARVKEPRAARRVGDTLGASGLAELGSWPVQEMELIQSRLSPKGSTYTSLGTFELGRRVAEP